MRLMKDRSLEHLVTKSGENGEDYVPGTVVLSSCLWNLIFLANDD